MLWPKTDYWKLVQSWLQTISHKVFFILLACFFSPNLKSSWYLKPNLFNEAKDYSPIFQPYSIIFSEENHPYANRCSSYILNSSQIQEYGEYEIVCNCENNACLCFERRTMINKITFLSKQDVFEWRYSQPLVISFNSKSKNILQRVSTWPTTHKERDIIWRRVN